MTTTKTESSTETGNKAKQKEKMANLDKYMSELLQEIAEDIKKNKPKQDSQGHDRVMLITNVVISYVINTMGIAVDTKDELLLFIKHFDNEVSHRTLKDIIFSMFSRFEETARKAHPAERATMVNEMDSLAADIAKSLHNLGDLVGTYKFDKSGTQH